MLIRPGPTYPELGGRVDNLILPAPRTLGNVVLWPYPTGSPTERFLRINHVARDAGLRWRRLQPWAQAPWRRRAGEIQHWNSSSCFRLQQWIKAYQEDPEALYTANEVWNACLGLPMVDEPQEINTQPGGDMVVEADPVEDAPLPGCLVRSIGVLWQRNNTPADVPYFLAVSARMVNTIPSGEFLRQGDRWGGVVPIRYGEPVIIQELLEATGVLYLGASIWVQWCIGERGFVPFALGHLSVDNRRGASPVYAGWGLRAWGLSSWGS